jgi:hypothetical protein
MRGRRLIARCRSVESRARAYTVAGVLAALIGSVAGASGESPKGTRLALVEAASPAIRAVVADYAARDLGSNGTSTGTTPYVAGEVDLDGSPPLEIVARFEGSWCEGIAGCLLVVLSPNADGRWRSVLVASGDDLYVQAGRTRGWRDLEVAGGRGVGSYRWEGERYAFYEPPLDRMQAVRYGEARDPSDIALIRRVTGSLLDEVQARSGVPVTVEVAHRDLDGDRVPELLVVLRHPLLCRDDRCEQLIVMGSTADEDRIAFHQHACGPLRLLESRTDGVTDLVVRCDDEQSRRDHWVWKGEGYGPAQ